MSKMPKLKFTHRKLIARTLSQLAERMMPDTKGELDIKLEEFQLSALSVFVDRAMDSAPGNDVKILRSIRRILEPLVAVAAESDGDSLRFRLHIDLVDSQPPIWRRIEVPEMTLEDLHEVIQIAMGWDDSHPYEFDVDNRLFMPRVALEHGLCLSGAAGADEVLLSDIATRPGREFTYTYDLGDSWEHTITVEAVERRIADENGLTCVDGEGACPPEDCGGIPGYCNLIATIQDPLNPRHDELVEWLGYDSDTFMPEFFDPTEFSAVATDSDLKKALDWMTDDTESGYSAGFDPEITAFMLRFSESSEGRQAEQLIGDENPSIVEDFLAAADTHCGATIETMAADDVREVLFEILPDSFLIEPESAGLVVEELRLMILFAQRNRLAGNATDILAMLNDDAIKRLKNELVSSSDDEFGCEDADLDFAEPRSVDLNSSE
jgi:Plasmid pRiA4b ORF-3-like protein